MNFGTFIKNNRIIKRKSQKEMAKFLGGSEGSRFRGGKII